MLQRTGNFLGVWFLGPAMALVGAVVLIWLTALAPRADQPVALVFSPWTSSTEAVRATAAIGGLPMASGGADFVIMAIFDKDVSTADLRRGGVWLSLDPGAASIGCYNTAPDNPPGPAYTDQAPKPIIDPGVSL